ncbi:hypothetical protein C8J57DRAFT_1240255 [Mycena rebaudengoi]|nr:hypothetical protein C8J57DRAFT_1240255 [Mycena rebaudengoi]
MQTAAFVSFVGFLGVLRNKPPTYGCTATAPSQTSYSPLCSPYSQSPHLLAYRPPRGAPRAPPNPSLPPPAPHPPAPRHMHGARTARAQRPRAPSASRAINRSSRGSRPPVRRASAGSSAPGQHQRGHDRAATLPPRRLDTLRAHAELCPLRSHPSSDGTDAEQGAASLSTLSTAASIRILPLPAHLSPNDIVYVGARRSLRQVDAPQGEGGGQQPRVAHDGGVGIRHAAQRDEYTSYSGARCVQERGGCWDMRDYRDTHDGWESSESREGQADAGPLPAGVVHAKWKWL